MLFRSRRFSVHIEMPLDATLLDFLLLVMRCNDAPMIMRLDAAKTAAKLMHAPPKPVVTLSPATIRRRRHGCGKPAGRRGMTPRALDGASAQHTGNRHDGQHHTIVVVAIPRKRGWRMPRPRAPSGSNQTPVVIPAIRPSASL